MPGRRFWLLAFLGLLAINGGGHVRAWDHAAADAIRAQVLDAAVATAMPGYTCTNVTAKGRSLWFYYSRPKPSAGDHAPSVEIQVRFNDGLPIVPLGKDWAGSEGMIGPTANLVGDEAVAYSGSLRQPPTNGFWVRARVGTRQLFLRDGDAPFDALTMLARSLAAALPTLPLPTSFELEESEKEKSNPEYMRLDREMFARITPSLLENPPRLDVLSPGGELFENGNLGFGYRLERRAATGGYLSLNGTVLWKDRMPEALQLTASYPGAPAPVEVYRKFFQSLFGDTEPAGQPLRRVWGYAQSIEPLPAKLFETALPSSEEMAVRPDHTAIEELMTPFWPTVYSHSGSKSLKKQFSHLDARACLYLLRSKNPLTRLLALGQLQRSTPTWQVALPGLVHDAEMICESVPQLATLDGCLMSMEKSQSIVDDFVAYADPEQ